MPISLAQMAANTKSVTFTTDQDGNTATIVYFPGKVTEKAISAMTAFASMGEGSAPADVAATFGDFNSMLVNLIKSWDVYDDAEQTIMFPLEAKRFAELPFAFRMQVLTSILQDIRPEAGAA